MKLSIRLLSLAALCALLCVPWAAAEPIYATLTVPIYFEPTIPSDIGLVNEALNRITRRKIGAEIRLIPLLNTIGPSADPRRAAEMRIVRESGVSFDIVIKGYMQDETVLLDSLLAEYGQGIQEALGEDLLDMARSSGPLHSLPAVSDHVASAGIALRSDILRKYNLSTENIHSLEDLDSIFQTVSEGEPDMSMVCGQRTSGSFLYRLKYTMVLPNHAIDRSAENPQVLTNYYATQSYSDAVHLFRKWFLKGYLPDQLPFGSVNAAQLVRSGELFSYFCAYKPGIEFEESVNSGTDMTVIQLMQPAITSRSLSLHNWGISVSCRNPGKAMQFLNLLYTDQETVDLLMHGIEGTHYVRNEDGSIGRPAGETADEIGYVNNVTWILPNQTVSSVCQGMDPDVWEQTAAFNRAARPADTLDFRFDDTGFSREASEIASIAARYTYGLETGQLDPDVYLPQMIREMDDAGFGEMLSAAQTQFDQWRMGGGQE